MCCPPTDLTYHKTCYIFLLLDFQMLITAFQYYHPFFLYVISRTNQNPSFNTPYDITTHIKSLICKITRFYMKIFTMRSYGTLNDISMISCVDTNNCMVYNEICINHRRKEPTKHEKTSLQAVQSKSFAELHFTSPFDT